MEKIAENTWLVTIIGGLFVAIVGGLILNYILKNRKAKKLKFELKTADNIEVGKDLTIGDINSNSNSNDRTHEVTLKKGGKVVVNGDFTVGNKQE